MSGASLRRICAVCRAFARSAAWLPFVLFMSHDAQAAATADWTLNGATSATTAVNDLIVTHSGSTGGGNYSNATFQTNSSWWTNPYGGTVSGGRGLSGPYVPGSGTLTITVSFSMPVTDPIVHVARIGSATSDSYNSTVWALSGSASQGGAVTMSRLSGNDHFVLDAVSGTTGFRRTTGGDGAQTSASCGTPFSTTGCGSIRFNGTGITQLSFHVTMRGGAGIGDALEFIWSFKDSETLRPRLTLRKTVVNDHGGTATATDFILRATNGGTTLSGKSGDAAITNASIAAGTWTLGETAVAGYAAGNYSCVVNGAAPISGNTLTLVNGNVAVCTVTNDDIPAVISLTKALAGNRVAAGDNFSVAIRTGGVNGTIVSSTANATTAGDGSTVAPGTGTTGDFNGVAGTAFTLTEAGVQGTQLANYGARLSCTDANGVMPAASLPTNEAFDPALGRAITPPNGATLRCTITNTPMARQVSGRVFQDNGAGGGTANDGIRNGSEAPLAGVTVQLTNCAATVISSVLTDASGSYRFAVPIGTAKGAAFCVEETDGRARLSTGASVGATALASGSAVAAAGGTYTYTRPGTPDRIAFSWNGTGHADLNFGDVDNSSFATSGAKTGLPDSTVTYPHTFTAGSAGQVRFSIAGETASPALAGWTAQIFADADCTGSLQPGAAQLYPPAGAGSPVALADKVCVIVKQFIPASAPLGANNKLAVRADFEYLNASPALAASFVLDDITTVASSALELKKEVRNVTQNVADFGINNQAKSGETLEYRITYTNNGDAPIRDLTINDTTPGYTRFVSATTGATPATLTGCTKNTPANALPAAAVACAVVQPAGGVGPVDWKFIGFVVPGGTGSVLFQVKVD
jgi:trimeric autotransporter adhesin